MAMICLKSGTGPGHTHDRGEAMNILVLNSGSSSQKSCVYQVGDTLPENPPDCLWEGRIEWKGDAATTTVKILHDIVEQNRVEVSSHAEAVEHLLATLRSGGTRGLASAPDIDVVGHRIVHGGSDFKEPVRITPDVKSAIRSATAFAPLHNQAGLEGMQAVENVLGSIPQVAVFDTGYHRTLPPAAAVYPGPYEWFESGIRRYGFHGINHEYCAERAARLLRRDLKSLRLVTCHLGNGCSLAAISDGASIDTTMGFTPLEGLMMGTRSGSVDPGILTYLMRQDQLQAGQIDTVLNHKSGLLGISGVSGDMREILAAMNEGHTRARLAFDIYVHRLKAGIGAMVAVLGGVDALVFTAGIGENSPEIRAAACGQLEFLGLKLDSETNAQTAPERDISTADSQVRILVIRAQEDWAIAEQCWKLTRRQARLNE
jgi:acetate kinase